jgi:hypothetical protein
MSVSSVLAFALGDQLNVKGVTIEGLSRSLGYRSDLIVRMWLDGRARPQVDQLPEIAKLLDMDVVQLGLLYLMDSSERMDVAVRENLSELCMWPEIVAAHAQVRKVRDEDMSVSDPADADFDDVSF